MSPDRLSWLIARDWAHEAEALGWSWPLLGWGALILAGVAAYVVWEAKR